MASITMQLEALPQAWGGAPQGRLEFTISSPDRQSGGINSVVHLPNGSSIGVSQLPSIAPNHVVVPYLSKRKVSEFVEDVRAQFAMQISNTMTHLAARLSMVSNQYHPRNRHYSEACQEILGFVVTCIPSPSGQQPGIYLPNAGRDMGSRRW